MCKQQVIECKFVDREAVSKASLLCQSKDSAFLQLADFRRQGKMTPCEFFGWLDWIYANIADA